MAPAPAAPPVLPVAPPATPAAAPVAVVPEAKESFWQRFKGTIELVGALIAIGGLGFGAYKYFSGTTAAEVEKKVKASIEEKFVRNGLHEATITEIILVQSDDNVFTGFIVVKLTNGSKLEPSLKVTVDPKSDELVWELDLE